MLDIALLGTGGMMPMPNRFLASAIVRLNGNVLIIDCGEGTQVSLKTVGWGFKAISTICFTHYHADHISGLPGMLLTIGNSGRTEPVTLIGPTGLIKVVEGLRVIAPELPYEIKYIEISGGESFNINGFDISALCVEHIIKCIAYRIDVLRKGKFDVKKAMELNIPQKFWSKLQNGENITFEGKSYTSDMVMGTQRKGIRFAYCTDSRPTAQLPEFIYEADLFVCEGMYGEDEKLEKAIENKHMLFSEAAKLALKGQVKELILTHFSPALSEPEEFILNAQNIFENTVIGFDGILRNIAFENRL